MTKEVSQGFLTGGLITALLSGFSCLISFGVSSEYVPWTSNISGETANQKAINLAHSMGFKSTIITVNSPVTGNAQYLLSPYDNFYYQCTGHIPGGTENSMWTKNHDIYSRTGYWNDAYKYKIPITNQMTPEQKAMAEKFNALFEKQSHIYHPGNAKALKNTLLAEKWIGIIGGTITGFLLITAFIIYIKTSDTNKNKKINSALKDGDKTSNNLKEKEGECNRTILPIK